MKSGMIGEVPGNVLGMMADLAHKLQHGKITPAEFGRFLKRENPFVAQQVADPVSLLSSWAQFYYEVFHIDWDFSKLRIPEKREGFDRLLVVHQGLTPEKIFAKCREFFPVWKYSNNLDEIVSDRDSKNGTYAIWVRDRQEADEEEKNKSANQFKAENAVTETLPERLIHELKYFRETGKHLDEKNYTLCAGSRHPSGRVPNVYWNSGCDKMDVHWYDPDLRGGGIRARVAVS